MKKFFEEPIVEITKFMAEDVVTASEFDGEQGENDTPIG